MSATAGAVLLIVVGGLLQVAGVGMVVVEVHQTRERVRSYRTRGVRIRPFPIRARSSMSATPVVTPMTPEQRLADVEKAVEDLARRLEQQRVDLTKKLESEWQHDVSAAATGLTEDLNDLAALVLGLNDPRGLQRAKLGAVLIIVGLMLATSGSVWSTYL